MTLLKKKRIRLAVFDIDGTLVPYETHMPAAETVSALADLKEQGIYIAAATGRQFTTIQPVIKEIGFDYYLCANGSCITDQRGNPLLVSIFERSTVEKLIGDFTKHRKPLMFRYLAGGVQINPEIPMEQYSLKFFTKTQIEQMKQEKPPVIPEEELPYAALCHIENEDLRLLTDAYPELRFTMTAGGALCDINLKDMNKGTGMNKLCRLLSIDKTDVMSFGDDRNDIELIREAGIGIAMGNAVPEVRDIADYITDTCMDLGVVKALAHFGLHSPLRDDHGSVPGEVF